MTKNQRKQLISALRQEIESSADMHDIIEALEAAAESLKISPPPKTHEVVPRWILTEGCVFIDGIEWDDEAYEAELPNVQEIQVWFDKGRGVWREHPSGRYVDSTLFETEEAAKTELKRRLASLDSVIKEASRDVENAPKRLAEMIQQHGKNVQRIKRFVDLLAAYRVTPEKAIREQIWGLRNEQ